MSSSAVWGASAEVAKAREMSIHSTLLRKQIGAMSGPN